MADYIYFESLSKEKAIFVDIANVFLLCVELSIKFSKPL